MFLSLISLSLCQPSSWCNNTNTNRLILDHNHAANRAVSFLHLSPQSHEGRLLSYWLVVFAHVIQKGFKFVIHVRMGKMD